MTVRTELSPDHRTLTVSVPLVIRRRGGRKRVVTPEGSPAWAPQKAKIDSTLLKALARAFRWKYLLDSGAFVSIGDLGSAERINHSYIRRLLRLTLISPSIVEMILDGRQPRHLQLETLLQPIPAEWVLQEKLFIV